MPMHPPKDGRQAASLARQMLASAVEPLVRTPWPGIEERQVVGDGVDREKT